MRASWVREPAPPRATDGVRVVRPHAQRVPGVLAVTVTACLLLGSACRSRRPEEPPREPPAEASESRASRAASRAARDQPAGTSTSSVLLRAGPPSTARPPSSVARCDGSATLDTLVAEALGPRTGRSAGAAPVAGAPATLEWVDEADGTVGGCIELPRTVPHEEGRRVHATFVTDDRTRLGQLTVTPALDDATRWRVGIVLPDASAVDAVRRVVERVTGWPFGARGVVPHVNVLPVHAGSAAQDGSTALVAPVGAGTMICFRDEREVRCAVIDTAATWAAPFVHSDGTAPQVVAPETPDEALTLGALGLDLPMRIGGRDGRVRCGFAGIEPTRCGFRELVAGDASVPFDWPLDPPRTLGAETRLPARPASEAERSAARQLLDTLERGSVHTIDANEGRALVLVHLAGAHALGGVVVAFGGSQVPVRIVSEPSGNLPMLVTGIDPSTTDEVPLRVAARHRPRWLDDGRREDWVLGLHRWGDGTLALGAVRLGGSGFQDGETFRGVYISEWFGSRRTMRHVEGSRFELSRRTFYTATERSDRDGLVDVRTRTMPRPTAATLPRAEVGLPRPSLEVELWHWALDQPRIVDLASKRVVH